MTTAKDHRLVKIRPIQDSCRNCEDEDNNCYCVELHGITLYDEPETGTE